MNAPCSHRLARRVVLLALLTAACGEPTTRPESPRRSPGFAMRAAASCPTAGGVVVSNEAGLLAALAAASPGDVIALSGVIEVSATVTVATDGITLTCATAGSGLRARPGAFDFILSVMLMAMVVIGGEAIGSIAKTMTSGGATPATIEAMRAAARSMMLALVAGFLLSAPLMMAVWFAPLLVFFNDLKPMPALMLSLWACLRNILPFLVYGMAVLVPVVVLMPLSLAARQPDLGLWLLAPILVPSIYAGYRDLFVPVATTQ